MVERANELVNDRAATRTLVCVRTADDAPKWARAASNQVNNGAFGRHASLCAVYASLTTTTTMKQLLSTTSDARTAPSKTATQTMQRRYGTLCVCVCLLALWPEIRIANMCLCT